MPPGVPLVVVTTNDNPRRQRVFRRRRWLDLGTPGPTARGCRFAGAYRETTSASRRRRGAFRSEREMAMENLILYVATYDDAAAATEDCRTQGRGGGRPRGRVLGRDARDADGKVSVDEHGTGQVAAARGSAAPPGSSRALRPAPARGDGRSARLSAPSPASGGEPTRRRRWPSASSDRPTGSSAIVASSTPGTSTASTPRWPKAMKKVDKAIDKDDHEALGRR